MRLLLGVLSAFSLLFIIGCSTEENDISLDGIKGEIVAVKDNSLLIKNEDHRVNLKHTSDTVFIGKKNGELLVGDVVKTWYDSEPLDSNPMQAIASKIEFIE
ncbi:DUF3221 domain-containing protein [Gracilibacillus sp. YIM 98692]|uniref:DUF3221 domain-containing protein n=1 Tax=Gracilibacillus sp. YIM 98692 TaxID=2663532 RepID=UPI0013D7F3F8|nr:DUF3221 domain-containing protein [Gracilibacillus sp. YIM 98692]